MNPKYSAEMLAEAAASQWDKFYLTASYSHMPGTVDAMGRFPRVVLRNIPQSLLVLERAPSDVDDLRAEEWV